MSPAPSGGESFSPTADAGPADASPALVIRKMRVRREFWAYETGPEPTPEELLAETYRGIRPAPGYPSQPDHTEKVTLFKLLEAERRVGVKLTESYAMWPGSSVSGLYLSHPEAAYFGVAKIERDQVEDYAARKRMDVETVGEG